MPHLQKLKAAMKWWRGLVMVAVVAMAESVVSDPQTNLLMSGCSQYNTSITVEFFGNLNSTFVDLRQQLSITETNFATAQQARTTNPVYTLVQCRKYMSTADCVACFNYAAVDIRNICKLANGAYVVYDGCSLRYDIKSFYTTATASDNTGICNNDTVLNGTTTTTAFSAIAGQLVTELSIVTSKTKNYYAATTKLVPGGNTTPYAVAQCAETVSPTECQNCMNVAYQNIKNCPPRSGARAIDFGCFMRYQNTPFFASNQTTYIQRYLKSGSSDKNKYIIGGVGGVGLLFILLALFLWYRLITKKKVAQTGDILGVTKLQGPIKYNYKDLKSATKSFSEEYKIGEGGFGDVYKGIIKNGDVVAVKKLAITSSKAKADFESEVRLIGNVHHRNIIRLLGCSAKGSELLLVFEYMANESLDKFLYGAKRGTLSWKQRSDIIIGIARGLAYLHEQFHFCIIHRDIKSSNILLDDDFQPKIADFGLARLIRENQTHLSTRFAGTLGYTAPEYAIHGKLSEKVDTYSFGIVVLEIISGRRCTDLYDNAVSGSLLEYGWKLYQSDMDSDLVDETLASDEYNIENVKKIIEIALMCTQSPNSLRPTMSEVVVLLTNSHNLKQRPLSNPTLA